jgi:hypothetical protein
LSAPKISSRCFGPAGPGRHPATLIRSFRLLERHKPALLYVTSAHASGCLGSLLLFLKANGSADFDEASHACVPMKMLMSEPVLRGRPSHELCHGAPPQLWSCFLLFIGPFHDVACNSALCPLTWLALCPSTITPVIIKNLLRSASPTSTTQSVGKCVGKSGWCTWGGHVDAAPL